MELKSCIILVFEAYFINAVFSNNFNIALQEEIYLKNVTLDNKYENNTGWTFMTDKIPKWLEYYNNTSLFKANSSNTKTCANVNSTFNGELQDREGIWVACQDSTLPADCNLFTSCHPLFEYDSFTTGFRKFRTIKISFALNGLPILRLTAGSKCYDFTNREDTFSGCKLMDVSSNITNGGWINSEFVFDPYDAVGVN